MLKLFFSYSHKDEEYRNELENHLAMLKRQGVISSWYDRRITAGSNIGNDISTNLESSSIVLLLVSSNFLASDYCYEKEMERAMQLHEEGQAVVIPVILHPCDWHSAPFGALLATPKDGKPVSMHANQHEAFANIAKDIRTASESFNIEQSSRISHEGLSATVSAASRERSSNLRVKKTFSDNERDQFLEDTYEYIARYFEGSLAELEERNSHISCKFKRFDHTSFTAYIYADGQRSSECYIFHGGGGFSQDSICYSSQADGRRNTMNESISIGDDGYTLFLRPMGMQSHMRGNNKDALTQEGAAEMFWNILISRLQ